MELSVEKVSIWKLILFCIPWDIQSLSMQRLNHLAACVIIRSIVKRNCIQLYLISLLSYHQISWHTLDLSWLQIPTWSHKPTKYCPRFQPLWSPEMDMKPTTSDHKFHFPSFTSIQCTVIPSNDTFVVSAVHPLLTRSFQEHSVVLSD